ncbi:hypothetical protein Tcan_00150 [Toxocara canis]|uniref:Uncharacterized protein n=1 Tax=Toxocara canis TaxID=6265 RepID=A0A0B2VHV2_TOXCA|nr:hypothetical protein Tcan_00150 [Toxocara canis]
MYKRFGEEFNNYYGNTVQMARPVQGTPDVVYKYSSHHFDFDYVLSNQESELCQASAEKKKASTTSMSLNEEKSTGERFVCFSFHFRPTCPNMVNDRDEGHSEG